MIKYVDTFIGLREVPDEICLCINKSFIFIKVPNKELILNILKNNSCSNIYYFGSKNINLFWETALFVENLYPKIKQTLCLIENYIVDPEAFYFFHGTPFDFIYLGVNFADFSFEKKCINYKNINKIVYEIC